MWTEVFGYSVYSFGMLRNTSKIMDDDDDFALLLSMHFEILCLFLLESTHKVFFYRLEKLVSTADQEMFANPYKSLLQYCKTCRSWSVCRGDTNSQGVILNSALTIT